MTMSGRTPSCWKQKSFPVRPRPDWISSHTNSTLCFRQSASIPFRYPCGGRWIPLSPWIGSTSTAATFGGNPLAAAVAREALKVLVDERLVENSAALGEYFLERLKTIRSRWIKEIRGKGLWIGVELVPAAGGARRFCEALRDKGMLCKETHVHTIRFAPPLNVTREELDWALERIVAVFAALD